MERGWTPPKRGAGSFRFPIDGTGLVVEWQPQAEGYKYGGMRFGGAGQIVSPEIAAELMSYPDDVWVERERALAPANRLLLPWFAGTSAGWLLDPRGNYWTWIAQTSDEVTATVEEFFSMVDGPMARWIRTVTPVGTLLDWVTWGSSQELIGECRAESFALLALRHDRPNVAQAVLEVARRRSNEPEVLDAFEREIEARHPAALQRQQAPVAEHPLWRSVADALWIGFRARGWAPSATLPGTFETTPGEEGLVVQWTPAVELESGGGLRFGGVGALACPGATEALLRFPATSRPWAFDGLDDDGARAFAWLDVVTAGRLIDADGDERVWTVRSPEDAAAATADFFAMIDGPLANWIATTATLEEQLRLGSAAPRQLRRSRVRFELLVILALEHGRPEVARSIVRTGMRHFHEPLGRFGRFDNEIADRFPGYGPPQVHDGAAGTWLIDADEHATPSDRPPVP